MFVIRSLFMVSARVKNVRCFHSLKPSIKLKVFELLGMTFSKWARAEMMLIPFYFEFMINSL